MIVVKKQKIKLPSVDLSTSTKTLIEWEARKARNEAIIRKAILSTICYIYYHLFVKKQKKRCLSKIQMPKTMKTSKKL